MSITDWTHLSATKHPGEIGFALWKTKNFGDIRVRMVEYSPGYVADHWCSKGHVIFCLSGSIDIELKDGQRLALKEGQSTRSATATRRTAPQLQRARNFS